METKIIKTTFNARLSKSEKAVFLFDEFLKKNNIEYSESGYESMIKTENFMNKIRTLNDETSNRLRYFPDRTILTDKSTLVEIKYGRAIEKDAYENYKSLKSIGYNVGICFLFNEKETVMHYINIDFLPLKKAWQFASKRGIEIPIKEDYWYYPRDLNDVDYSIFRKFYGGSGTPFAHISYDIDLFKLIQT